MLENAQTQFQNNGYQLGAAQCLQSLGNICYTQGRYSDAQALLENAQSLKHNSRILDISWVLLSAFKILTSSMAAFRASVRRCWSLLRQFQEVGYELCAVQQLSNSRTFSFADSVSFNILRYYLRFNCKTMIPGYTGCSKVELLVVQMCMLFL